MTPIFARLVRLSMFTRGEHPLTPRRRLTLGALGLAVAALATACGDSQSTNPLGDHSPPSITLQKATAPSDSVLAFQATVNDNLGVKSVRVQVTGQGVTALFDTAFTSAVTTTDLLYSVNVPSSVVPGTMVTVVASAIDGARNSAIPDTLLLATGNVGLSLAVFTSPRSGDTAVVNQPMGISMSGSSQSRVRALGYIATGVFSSARTDSVLFRLDSLKDSVAVDTVFTLTGASTGTMTLTPFLQDSLNRRFLGNPVSVTVVNAAGLNTTPVVDFGLGTVPGKRVEVADTIHVEARDLAGVHWLGYEVTNLPSDPTPFLVRDSTLIASGGSPRKYTFKMNLPISSFPTQLQVRAFAYNMNGRMAYALNGSDTRYDTVTVVAGLTRALANGGTIADALYHPATDRLYLSNIDRNQLEVFNLPDTSFKTPIVTGSRPWGLAAWPRNRDGTMADTLLVANSGGTTIGYVDLRRGTTGLEIYRYPLPNIIPASVTSTLSPTGQVIQQLTLYDFSDRPQFLAATCGGPATGSAPCGDVVVVYSTTPTGGQSLPFPNKGSLRWENLTRQSSHFFFEQAMFQDQNRADTLRVDRYAAQGVGADSVLVPYKQKYGVAPDTAYYSVVITVPKLAFRDTTFVRGSGNFRRAVAGEGGSFQGSRAVMYDVTRGMQLTTVSPSGNTYALPVPVVDNGISRPVDVFDDIANTFQSVRGVSINFDGELAAIRGDSTYLIDRSLRLQGLMQTSGGNAGFDFHPLNAGIGPSTSPLGTRIAFAASDQPQLEVYDTYTYRQCLVIPTRDPIIGPIKSAVRAGSGGDIVLVGATSKGVVIVTVRASQLASCQ